MRDFEKSRTVCPRSSGTVVASRFWRDGGRLIKTHENYRSDYKRAVLLVRDVRDVFLSNYAGYEALGLAPIVSKGDIDSFLLSFLEGKSHHTGSWQQHTQSWLESPLANNGNLMVDTV